MFVRITYLKRLTKQNTCMLLNIFGRFNDIIVFFTSLSFGLLFKNVLSNEPDQPYTWREWTDTSLNNVGGLF